MIVPEVLATGFSRTNRVLRVVVLLYGLHALLALPVALTFQSTMAKLVGHFSAPSALLEDFDFTVMSDMLRIHGDVISALLGPVTWLALLAMLLMTFLKGGVIASLGESTEEFSLARFFSHCGTYWWRLFRLFLLLGVAMLVSILLVVAVAAGLGAATDDSSSEITFWLVAITIVLIGFIAAGLVLTIADYARIIIVRENTPSVVRGALQGVRFVMRNVGATVGVLAITVGAGLVCIALYVFLESVVGMTSVAGLVVTFLLQQCYLLCRTWLFVFSFGAELTLIERRWIPETGAASGVASTPLDPLLLQ